MNWKIINVYTCVHISPQPFDRCVWWVLILQCIKWVKFECEGSIAIKIVCKGCQLQVTHTIMSNNWAFQEESPLTLGETDTTCTSCTLLLTYFFFLYQQVFQGWHDHCTALDLMHMYDKCSIHPYKLNTFNYIPVY